MEKTAVRTENAPGAIGPYSQGIRAGRLVFSSGQLPKPADGDLIMDDITQAARQCLKNVEAVLNAGGATLADVVKVTAFLTDMGQFAEANAAYAEFFDEPFPARSCIEVAGLPLGVPIEIEAIAVVKEEA